METICFINFVGKFVEILCNLRLIQYRDAALRYRNSHHRDEAVMRLSHIYNRIPYNGKMAYLYWIGPKAPDSMDNRGWFNIKMSAYRYRKSHCGDKTILWRSYSRLISTMGFHILVWWHLYFESAGSAVCYIDKQTAACAEMWKSYYKLNPIWLQGSFCACA